MNRRNFIDNLLTATAGFTILPGAGRLWKAEAKIIEPVYYLKVWDGGKWVQAMGPVNYVDANGNIIHADTEARTLLGGNDTWAEISVDKYEMVFP